MTAGAICAPGVPSLLKRNLLILVCCQLISATGSIVVVTLGGIIGASLTAAPELATLPVSLLIVATAVTTVPATMLMRRVGRPLGFAVASATSILAVAVTAMALSAESFWLFVVASMLFGVNLAFTQQYRYAAAESVAPEHVPRAISFVLLGAIGGAIIGPELVVRGAFEFAGVPYAGTLGALGGLYLVQVILLLNLGTLRQVDNMTGPLAGRPLAELVSQPLFVVAVIGGMAGYGLMTLLMTATPLSMHVGEGYSLQQTAAVIRAHVVGMYAPSLVSGLLIERFGLVRLMSAGAVLLLGTSFVALQGASFLHYWWALVLLGVGWNFLYVGATTMLTYTYGDAERFRAQAVNELMVFGTAATTSLAAGYILHKFGWDRLVLVPFPVLVLVLIALAAVRRDPLLVRAVRS